MKICCISDLHGFLPEIPDCDILLIAGDIVPLEVQTDMFKSVGWLNGPFKNWLDSIFNRGITTVGIAGNHDFIFEKAPHLRPRDLFWVYLQDKPFRKTWGLINPISLNFWGSPWQPYYGGWAFNAYEDELETKWNLIPQNTDILIVHGSPYMHGDKVHTGQKFGGQDVVEHVGSPSLLRKIKEVKPKLVCSGHYHSGYGIYELDGTKIINASLVDESYKLVNNPILVEV